MAPQGPRKLVTERHPGTGFWVDVWMDKGEVSLSMVGLSVRVRNDTWSSGKNTTCMSCGWSIISNDEKEALRHGWAHWRVSHGRSIPWGPNQAVTYDPLDAGKPISSSSSYTSMSLPLWESGGDAPEEPAFEGSINLYDHETVEKLAQVIAIDGEHEEIVTSSDRELARSIMDALGLVQGDPYTYAVTNPHDERKHIYPTVEVAMRNCVRVRDEYIVRQLGPRGKWEKYIPTQWRDE
ncbi:hypothetical protein QEH42_gp186 [Microbacterium phage Pumpernickel]|uniref:Uncharacterized protein n=1 Tax=Microbacterium phage Pumpernickel TaxID=2885983 RepID=A0AAE8YA47_9CAUD|nr:hypothetical protein QEH42_gp186 [Microbacterium phage Pumpernickel]UDL16032.1 hypothetical protein SEA_PUMPERNICKEL_282 [Microbacterium phage Pumpernickel]